MSPYMICTFVGATTLAAAVIILCSLEAASARKKTKRSNRALTLAESRPGRRRLSSSIPLDAPNTRREPSSSKYEPQHLKPARPTVNDIQEGQFPLASNTAPSPNLTREARLHSIQTIQARSSALGHDKKPGNRVRPKPSVPDRTSSDQGLSPPLPPVQDHVATCSAESEQTQHQIRTSQLPDTGGFGDLSEAKIASLPPTPRVAENAGATYDVNPLYAWQGTVESLDDPQTLGPSDALESAPDLMPESDTTIQGIGMPNILAGWGKEEPGLPGIADNLDDIDGGSLPGTTPKTLQALKR